MGILIVAVAACSSIVYGSRMVRSPFSTHCVRRDYGDCSNRLLDWRYNGRGETPLAVYLLIAILSNGVAAVVASIFMRERWKNNLALIMSIIAWMLIVRGCI